MLLICMSAGVESTKSPVSQEEAAPATHTGAACVGHKGLIWKRPSTAEGRNFASSGGVGHLRDC
jgi:hypothetical protein